jgi:predicted flavoprotein YhiN
LDAFINKINSYKKPPVYTRILMNSNVEALEKTMDINNEQYMWKVKFRQDNRSDLLKNRNPEKLEKIQELVFDKLIIASGGLSVINRDGACLQLLYKLGHRIIPLFPALTPLLSHPEVRIVHEELAGISTQKVIISVIFLDEFNQTKKGELIYKASDPDGFLFTHRGYSGPAVLNASHHTIIGENLEPLQYFSSIEQENRNLSFDLNDGDSIENLMFHTTDNPGRKLCLEINWTPEISFHDWDRLLVSAHKKGTKQLVKNFVQKTCQGNMFLPIRLIELLLRDEEDMSNWIVSQLTKEQRHRIINRIIRYRIIINGNEGLKKAEVTGGGVDLRDIDSVTLESRMQPNLYICGEALDAFGCIGGFNFAIAWITGKMAGTWAVSSLN